MGDLQFHIQRREINDHLQDEPVGWRTMTYMVHSPEQVIEEYESWQRIHGRDSELRLISVPTDGAQESQQRKLWRHWLPPNQYTGEGGVDRFSPDYEEHFGQIPRTLFEVGDAVALVVRKAVVEALKEQGLDEHEWGNFGRRHVDWRAVDAACIGGMHEYGRWLDTTGGGTANPKPPRATSDYQRITEDEMRSILESE